MQTKARLDVSPEIIQQLGDQLADYRLNGCTSGGAIAVQQATRKIANKHGQSFSELWAKVHAAAYVVIDADPRAAIG